MMCPGVGEVRGGRSAATDAPLTKFAHCVPLAFETPPGAEDTYTPGFIGLMH